MRIKTACGSGRVFRARTRPLPQAVLTGRTIELQLVLVEQTGKSNEDFASFRVQTSVCFRSASEAERKQTEVWTLNENKMSRNLQRSAYFQVFPEPEYQNQTKLVRDYSANSASIIPALV